MGTIISVSFTNRHNGTEAGIEAQRYRGIQRHREIEIERKRERKREAQRRKRQKQKAKGTVQYPNRRFHIEKYAQPAFVSHITIVARKVE